MESLSNDILWLILKNVIGTNLFKGCARLNHLYFLKNATHSNVSKNASPEKCKNSLCVFSLTTNELCPCCDDNLLYRSHNTVMWTCGCNIFTSKYSCKYYCSLHSYMNIKGPLGPFSHYDLANKRAHNRSLELLMDQLSRVNHQFHNLLRSRCTWFDTSKKIWAFKENILL